MLTAILIHVEGESPVDEREHRIDVRWQRLDMIESSTETEDSVTRGYRGSDRPPWREPDAGNGLNRLVGTQAGLMILVAVLLGGLELWSPERYFVASFLGLLFVRFALAPTERVPRWWTHLNWIVRLGFLVFGYLVLRRLPELLP